LRIEFEGLEALNFDLGLTGFSAEEIGAIRQGLNGGLTDPDDVPEPPVAPVTRLGDVWTMRGHRIVCGDATDKAAAAAALAGAKPHLMATDPPYGVSYDPMWRDVLGIDWTGQMQRKSTHSSAKSKPVTTRSLGKVENDDRADWRDAWALFPGDVAYVWHADRHASSVQASLAAAGFEIRCQAVWVKQHFVFGRGDYHWRHEPCWYAVRKGRRSHWATASRRPFGRSPTPAHSRASKATPSPITGRKSRSSA
jgi:DNA modification methylase